MIKPCLAIALALFAIGAQAQVKEQFVPAMFRWAGLDATEGTGVAAGMLDYFEMLNRRDGGVNGVRFAWKKCDTGMSGTQGVKCYERLKSGAGSNLVVSLGDGHAESADGTVFPHLFPLIATVDTLAATIVRLIGEEEKGLDKLRGKRITLLREDSAFGREPEQVLMILAGKYGYEFSAVPVPVPGTDQTAQWQRIREIRPDWVILWGRGAMNPAALRGAEHAGYPSARIVGLWFAGAEEDVIAAGAAARKFVVASLNAAGAHYPVIRSIRKHVYPAGNGETKGSPRIGSIYYNRGVVFGIITAEAMLVAQQHFGKGKPVSGEQMQWALEHLDLDNARLRQLGAAGFMPPVETSCADHEGSGLVRFFRWDGTRWNSITDWMAPMPDDRKLVRMKYRESAKTYALGNGITPRKCVPD